MTTGPNLSPAFVAMAVRWNSQGGIRPQVRSRLLVKNVAEDGGSPVGIERW